MNLRTIITAISLLALLSAGTAGYLYYLSARESACKAAQEEIVSQTEAARDRVTQLIMANRKEVRILAGFEELQAALITPNEQTVTVANRILDHFAEGLDEDICYLLDRDGNAIASSNRHKPDSFVGVNYGFRPYFRQAMSGSPSVYPALGVTSGVRGIYLGQPVFLKGHKQPVGVVVVKTSVESLDRTLSADAGDIALMADDNGVIFVSGRKEWVLRLLWKPGGETLQRIGESRQFGEGPFQWTGLETRDCGRAVTEGGEEYLIHEMPIDNCPGWKIVYMSSLQVVTGRIIQPMTAISGYVALALVILVGGTVAVLRAKGHRDIELRRQAEESLQLAYDQLVQVNRDLIESQHRIRVITDSLPACISYVDRDHRYRFANRTYELWYGIPPEQMIGKHVGEIIGQEAYSKAREFIEQALSGQTVAFENKLPGLGGHVREGSVIMVPDFEDSGRVRGYFALVHDITELKQIQENLEKTAGSLETSLREKEALLREVHHRVKNNLAVIVSLVRMQSHYRQDSAPEGVFGDIERRVRAMALAHEKLYQSENLAEIGMSEYISDLADHLVRSVRTLGKSVSVHKDLDSVPMPLERAMPVGIIVTELVSNSMKHAFPDRTQGTIDIGLHCCGTDKLELTVSDDGVGMPDGTDFNNPRSMGMDLVNIFVSQLEGEIRVIRGRGTSVRVVFPGKTGPKNG